MKIPILVGNVYFWLEKHRKATNCSAAEPHAPTLLLLCWASLTHFIWTAFKYSSLSFELTLPLCFCKTNSLASTANLICPKLWTCKPCSDDMGIRILWYIEADKTKFVYFCHFHMWVLCVIVDFVEVESSRVKE